MISRSYEISTEIIKVVNISFSHCYFCFIKLNWHSRHVPIESGMRGMLVKNIYLCTAECNSYRLWNYANVQPQKWRIFLFALSNNFISFNSIKVSSYFSRFSYHRFLLFFHQHSFSTFLFVLATRLCVTHSFSAFLVIAFLS